MVLISSCIEKTSKAQLLSSKILNDFPSASAIEYDDGKLYIFGDDAPYLLILDTSYNRIDTIRYSTNSSFRIEKTEKADIESATIVEHNNARHLMALGSFSKESRMNLFHLPFAGKAGYSLSDLSHLAGRLKNIPALNIEGMAVVQNKIVLANRANKKHRVNKLIIGEVHYADYKQFSPSSVIDLKFASKNIIGISGLFYLKEKDILLFTASEEDTDSATEDGAISDSYLGTINEFSKKLKAQALKPTEMIKLSSVDKILTKQKIESVCVQKINGKEVLLHLVSDNDDGKSGLYKMRLIL